MKRILFFDDDDCRHQSFRMTHSELTGEHVVHVHRPSQAIEALRTQPFDEVWLDHDMDFIPGEMQTGMAVALFIADHLEWGKQPERVIIHSWNAEAAGQMAIVLKRCPIKTIVLQEFGSRA